MKFCRMKKRTSRKQGSALILTLLMLALMLTLVLYYVSMVRLETQVSGFDTSLMRSRGALDQALAEVLAEVEGQHRARAEQGRAYLAVTSYPELLSTGEGGALTNGMTEAEVEALGWPDPAGFTHQLSRASWVIAGDSNAVHTAYAWAVLPLTGMLDPQGLKGWNVENLLDPLDVNPIDRVYFSAAEFKEAHEGAEPYFLPGNYSRDRGWYDFTTSTWQTEVTVGKNEVWEETVSMNPLNWTDAQVAAVFKEQYPDRDYEGLAKAFLDFRDGKTVPTNPDSITAVPVPMFNEVSATMTVKNIGDDKIQITHELNLELWYPYGNANDRSYRVAMTPALESTDAGLALARGLRMTIGLSLHRAAIQKML